MLNRTIAPDLQAIEGINFIEPASHAVSSGCTLYHMKDVANDTARFDLYFDGGKARSMHGIASFVNGLLLSGTPSKNANRIQEEIHALGGYYSSGVSMENSVVTLYCLRDYLLPLFELILDAIQHVTFDEKEVRTHMADAKQRHLISMEKVSYQAQRAFQEKLFSTNAEYASVIDTNTFDRVNRRELIEFHKNHYLGGLTKIVVVGNVGLDTIARIMDRGKPLANTKSLDYAQDLKNEVGVFHFGKDNALQSAIRVGRILFNKTHEDYFDFLVLNTILGDYFGSRLMSNIREDKGFTYGIGSGIAELKRTGYFTIATEVGKDVRIQALEEIRKELEKLQNELVEKTELERVKNYLLGDLLKSADGPYAMMDLFLSAEMNGFDLNFYNQIIHRIKTIEAEHLREVAKKYLSWDTMSVVSCG